ncbi:MAG: flagellar filament capping protein FliD [Pseudomonadota bacterium]
MAGLTTNGLGSGLDVNSLVTQLVQAERAPAASRISSRETKVQSRLSAYGSLRSTVAEFQATLKKLQSESAFKARTAQVSNDTLIKATAGTQAATGLYNVSVEALATTQKLASSGFAAATTSVGTGRLDISAGAVNFSVTVAAGNDSLSNIRDAINNASGNPGVRATVINASTGSHLVLTAAGSGSAQGISINAVFDPLNGDTGDLGQLNYNPVAGSNPMEVKTPAADACILLDGFTLTSPTNTFSGAIDGVTLVVAKSSPGEKITLNINEDRASTRQAIDQFVAGYNKLQTQINTLTAYNPTTQVAGQLQGDAVTQRLASVLKSEINTALAGASLDLDSLAELGISSQAKTGTLSVNATRLDAVLSTRMSEVATLFSGSSGLASRFAQMLDGYASTTGVIEGRSSSLRTEVKTLSAQKQALDLRMTALDARYRKQFTALDSLLAGFSNTSSFLTQQLAKLS